MVLNPTVWLSLCPFCLDQTFVFSSSDQCHRHRLIVLNLCCLDCLFFLWNLSTYGSFSLNSEYCPLSQVLLSFRVLWRQFLRSWWLEQFWLKRKIFTLKYLDISRGHFKMMVQRLSTLWPRAPRLEDLANKHQRQEGRTLIELFFGDLYILYVWPSPLCGTPMPLFTL